MEKISSVSALLGFILMANEAASPLSIHVFLCSCRVFKWIAKVQSLCRCLCSLLQDVSCFLISTWDGWSRGKNADDATASTSRSHSDDRVGNEAITREDLVRVMEKLGIVWEPTGEEKEQSLGLGEISTLFNEIEPSLEEVKEAFDLFDENKDGYIDAKELENMLCALGIKETSESECQEMILAFDGNGDRRIDFSEFLRIVEHSFC